MKNYGKLNIVDSKTKIKKQIKELIKDCENYELEVFCWLVNGWNDDVEYDNYNIVTQLTIDGKHIPQGCFTWKEGYARIDNEYEKKSVDYKAYVATKELHDWALENFSNTTYYKMEYNGQIHEEMLIFD